MWSRIRIGTQVTTAATTTTTTTTTIRDDDGDDDDNYEHDYDKSVIITIIIIIIIMIGEVSRVRLYYSTKRSLRDSVSEFVSCGETLMRGGLVVVVVVVVVYFSPMGCASSAHCVPLVK